MLYNAAAGLGLDRELSKVDFPIDLFLVGSNIDAVTEQAESFVTGLTHWRPATDRTGLREPPRVRIEANGYEAALDQMNRLFLKNTWGDGLPLYAPSEERVEWILQGTDRPRDEVIGKIMPKGGIATVETVAVALAMAGGRPEYLPVLNAALEAFLDPALEHDKLQATSGSTFPVVIVNGPIAREIRLNSGFGLLGPDPQHPAGASIGRALRLLQQNVGGALPGVGTMAIFGGMRYTNAVFAEDEEGLPEGWSSVGSERLSLAPGQSMVTVYVGTSASNIVRRGVGKEAPMEEALQSLQRVASYLGSACVHYTHGWAHGTPGALLIPRPVAMQLRNLGWESKQSIKDFLFEHSKLPADLVRDSGLKQWIEASNDPDTLASADDDPWSITRRAEQILIVVAGGAHPTHNFWMQAMSPAVISRPIQTPGRWQSLVDEADAELGPGGEMCVI
ncbi:MAG: hypothetical protein KDK91_02265 [Gammaproteobacteria bacterium]|nr:hypothetical protein [Gammaproteobacteria bacterium]